MVKNFIESIDVFMTVDDAIRYIEEYFANIHPELDEESIYKMSKESLYRAVYGDSNWNTDNPKNYPEDDHIAIEYAVKPFLKELYKGMNGEEYNKCLIEDIYEVDQNAKKLFPDLYASIADDINQDEIPEYEESQKVDINPSQAQTNMASGPVINLGTGVPIVPEQINEEIAKDYDPSNPARMFLQPEQNIIPTVPVAFPNGGMIPPQQIQPPLHKVDEVPRPQKQVPQEDAVNVELNKLNFTGLKEPSTVKEIPPVIDHPMGNAEKIDESIKENLFNNDELFAMYPKIPLREIEEIANKNGHNVSFYAYPYDGLITVITSTRDGHNAVVPKCFTIDCGKIIDSRVKLFAACPMLNQEIFLEFAPVYELFVRNPKTHNKNMLDEKLINDIFIAGLGNISKKEMYTDIYKALNRKLALITIPTKGLNKEERNSLQTYLLNMDRDGYFDKAISLAPGSRFAFLNDKLDKNALNTFTLVNEGVPMYYGTGPMKVTPVIIESKNGQISIRSNGEIIDPGQINVYPQHPEGCTCGHC